MGIIIVQDTLPGFPHTPFRPVDERFLLFDRLKPRRRGLRGLSYFTDRRRASASSGTA